jgi:hypothetical protein
LAGCGAISPQLYVGVPFTCRGAPIRPLRPLALALSLLLAGAAVAQEDAGPGDPGFHEGDVIPFDQVDRLKPYLPRHFWDNRDFFFYEGMRLEIGPTQADYSPAQTYQDATEQFRGQPRVGPDDSLENYTAGQPFPMDEIDCTGDPEAGAKIMWNHDYQWGGGGGGASFYYSYWDRGEQLPLYYRGSAQGVKLSHRSEPEYLKSNGGDVFRKERRKGAGGPSVEAPFDARGIKLLTYRYKDSDKPRSEAKNDDTWVYLPTLRRVRRISAAQRTDAISGTDFTMDDLRSFNGIVPQYEWTCLEERWIIGPMNTKVKGYPYEEEHNFGPYGLSFADDRWELRKAVKIRMVPKNDDHPYHHKDIWFDKQTLTAMFSFAFDRKEELWKIIWHNKRWSGDHTLTGEWYKGWKDVPEPRDLLIVSDVIVNAQTGTGNRIEFWDANGTPLKSKGKIRRFIDVGRLTRGR